MQVVAGNNLLVNGSAVAGDGDVKLKAGNNVDIVAATNSDTSGALRKRKIRPDGLGRDWFHHRQQQSTHDLREKGTTQSQSFSTVGSTGVTSRFLQETGPTSAARILSPGKI